MQLPAPVAPDIPLGQEATITCTGPGCIVTTSTATSAIVVGVVKNGTYSVGVSLRNCVGRGGVAVTDNIGRPQQSGVLCQDVDRASSYSNSPDGGMGAVPKQLLCTSLGN